MKLVRGQSAAMRVLIADSDSESLEAVGRAFEVDIATSKATCVDLLRANDFDVVVAAERLDDGSGLELLSQVAKRWPEVVRILAIEPARRALLKGKLAPFKLFDTIPYPIEPAHLEGALQHAAEFCEPGESPPAREPQASGVTGARARLPQSKASYSNAPPRPATPPARHSPQTGVAQPVRPRAPANPDSPPPLPSRAAMRSYVPLGTADTQSLRILPRDHTESAPEHPLIARLERTQEKAQPVPPSKAASLAAAVHAAVKNYINPDPPPPPAPIRRRPR
jgi:hypothetical protein